MDADMGPAILFILGLLGAFFGFWVGGWIWGNFAWGEKSIIKQIWEYYAKSAHPINLLYFMTCQSK